MVVGSDGLPVGRVQTDSFDGHDGGLPSSGTCSGKSDSDKGRDILPYS